jgi:hypothetical protein
MFITRKVSLDGAKPFYVYHAQRWFSRKKAVLCLSRAKAVWTEQSRFIFIHAQRRFISCKAIVVGQAQALFDALSHGVLAASLSICTYNKNEEMYNVILTCEINCVISLE